MLANGPCVVPAPLEFVSDLVVEVLMRKVKLMVGDALRCWATRHPQLFHDRNERICCELAPLSLTREPEHDFLNEERQPGVIWSEGKPKKERKITVSVSSTTRVFSAISSSFSGSRARVAASSGSSGMSSFSGRRQGNCAW